MTNEEEFGKATTALLNAYVDCLWARFQYLDAVSAGISPPEREAHHSNLHSTVMKWFEALHGYIADRDDLEKYWEDIELFPLHPKTFIAVSCSECGAAWRWEPEAPLQPEVPCPDCNLADLELERRYETDEENNVVWKWETGLESLERYQDETETVTKTVGRFKKRTVTREVPLRLSPSALMRVARILDKVAYKLDMLSDIKDSIPNTEITKDTIKEFRERVEEITEKHDDVDIEEALS